MAEPPSSAALDAQKQVELLSLQLQTLSREAARRLDEHHKVNESQTASINKLDGQISTMAGVQSGLEKAAASNAKYIGPASSLFFLVVSAFLVNYVAGNIGRLQDDLAGNRAEIAVLKVQLASVKSPDLAQINERSLENRFANEKQEEGIARLRTRLDITDAKVESQATDIASMRASVGSALVEVETQIRALVDLENTDKASVRQLLGTIWPKVFAGETLQENDYFPSNIPAQAFTEVGKLGAK